MEKILEYLHHDFMTVPIVMIGAIGVSAAFTSQEAVLIGACVAGIAVLSLLNWVYRADYQQQPEIYDGPQ